MTSIQPTSRRRFMLTALLPGVATLLLLGGMALERMARPAAADASEYHVHVREAIAAFPMKVGRWTGVDMDVPTAAMAMLRPNAMVSRRYDQIDGLQQISFLFEHCSEARDMSGHYPPVCYPSNGWVAGASRRTKWLVRGEEFTGYEYEFSHMLPERTTTVVVANIFVLPNGRLAADMDAVRDIAADYTIHFYGAAQIQMCFDATVDIQTRREIFAEFLDAAYPAIDIVRNGVKR